MVMFGVVYLMADDDRYENNNYKMHVNKQSVSSPQKKLYINECASCHMAYQAEFLPKSSWNKMLNTLEKHFGVDATVEPEDKQALFTYLKENAADSKSVSRHFYKMARSIKGNDVVLRISQTPYFKKEHRGIRQNLIEQKEVKSISNCVACHQQAERGNYGENSIYIPNYGRWDD